MLEEQLKNKIAARYFKKYDCTDIIKRIDFTVRSRDVACNVFTNRDIAHNAPDEYLLWAEAKQSATDIYKMLAQLVVTIKQDAYNILPPKFIGCFDNEKIAFVEYNEILPIYALNDFNWTQTPSQVDDKSVAALRKIIKKEKVFTFYFGKDDDVIHSFIEQNFVAGGSLLSTLIDKNNFIFVYQKWREMVMPSINADWDMLKTNYAVYDRDFFLAELNIDDNNTTDLNDDKVAYPDFYITFNANSPTPYILKRTDALGLDFLIPFKFKRGGIEKYAEFWKRYKRPPKNVYWEYIVSRLDLLVPQDVRERKGAFFTPQIWVEKSQRCIADVLGEDWQDNYYIWDCCAGTGNLLNGLSDKYKIFASTIDQQDVDVMKDRIKNGANLLESHVFQFDFLNDDFSKCPESLRKILDDPKKRKKLVIYINPPYKEAASRSTVAKTGQNATDVAVLHKTYNKYFNQIGIAGRELFAQFFIRIYNEIPDCFLAQFSTLKILQAPNFEQFRNSFKAKLEKMFLVPANSFDNVSGKFPIGFFVWNCGKKQKFDKIDADVYDHNGDFVRTKKINAQQDFKSINDWIITTRNRKDEEIIGFMSAKGADFQNQNYNFIINDKSQLPHPRGTVVTDKNIVEIGIYLAVRQCIKHTLMNHSDQFRYPNEGWKKDNIFQINCLIYTIFHHQNNISCKKGTNNWIPFTENEVDARDSFDSHFMSDFLAGKSQYAPNSGTLFDDGKPSKHEIVFSSESKAVMDCGRELWRYYHTMEDANVNASLYDIKEYFQGRDKSGKMNAASSDDYYTELMDNLKSALWDLGECIKPKVYEYGFLE